VWGGAGVCRSSHFLSFTSPHSAPSALHPHPTLSLPKEGEGSFADNAGEMFSKLMGDVVEPQREFIQEFALEADVDA
jgi:hypothetical protein